MKSPSFYLINFALIFHFMDPLGIPKFQFHIEFIGRPNLVFTFCSMISLSSIINIHQLYTGTKQHTVKPRVEPAP